MQHTDEIKKRAHPAFFLTFALIFTVFFISVPAKANAASVRLNSTKKTMYVNDADTLKINGKTQKAKWKSSDSKVVRIIYDTNTGAVIQANKAGKATISVATDKSTLKCNITVRKETQLREQKKVLIGSQFFLPGRKGTKWTINSKYLQKVKTKNGNIYLKAIKSGSCTITAKYKKKTSKVKITIIPKNGGLKNKTYQSDSDKFTLDKSSVTVEEGKKITVTAKPEKNNSLKLSVSAASETSGKTARQIAEVSTDNNHIYITGRESGSITISVTNGTVTKKARVTVKSKKTSRHFINHRGYHEYAQENTLQAFKESKKRGFKYVETDVSFTKDGVPVLLHDRVINRVARNADGSEIGDNVYITKITYQEALQYDFGIVRGQKYKGTKIPALEEFLKLCKETGLYPYIELKNYDAYTQEQINTLVSMVKEYGMEENVTWISFNIRFLKMIASADRTARLGYLTSKISAETIQNVRDITTGENEVFIDAHDWSNAAISLCKNNNIPLEVWTIDKSAKVKELNSYISGVTSNILSK